MAQTRDELVREERWPTSGNGASHHETKHARFLRLATGRVQRALNALDLVGKLSSSENEYDENEAQQIINALTIHLEDVERRLTHQKPQKKMFTFD